MTFFLNIILTQYELLNKRSEINFPFIQKYSHHGSEFLELLNYEYALMAIMDDPEKAKKC